MIIWKYQKVKSNQPITKLKLKQLLREIIKTIIHMFRLRVLILTV